MEFLEEQTDCFAYRCEVDGERCNILNEMVCKKRKCPFHKTKEQFEEGLKRK